MVKKIKKILTNLGVAGILLVPAFVPAVAFAQGAGETPNIEGNLCGGAHTLTAGQQDACGETSEGQDRINNIIATIINVFSVVVGVVAVIMIIFGGFKYITSGGDSGNISSAKNTILFAIVGLVVVALAQTIVRFVLARATNSV